MVSGNFFVDKGRAGGRVGRTCHSQAFQLSQTQEGSGLYSADDITPQVPVGSSGETFALLSEGCPAPWVGHFVPQMLAFCGAWFLSTSAFPHPDPIGLFSLLGYQ